MKDKPDKQANKKIGRVAVFDPVERRRQRRECFLELLRTGLTITKAAQISRYQLSAAYKLQAESPEFSEQFEEAKQLSSQRRARLKYEMMERHLSKRACKGWLSREYEAATRKDGTRYLQLKKCKRMFSPQDARFLFDRWAEQAGLRPQGQPAGGVESLGHLHLHRHLHPSAVAATDFDPSDLTPITNEPRASGAYRVCRELRELARLSGGVAVVEAVGDDP